MLRGDAGAPCRVRGCMVGVQYFFWGLGRGIWAGAKRLGVFRLVVFCFSHLAVWVGLKDWAWEHV